MNSHMQKEQFTFDSTASGLGAFQIFNRNITSILKSMYPSKIEFGFYLVSSE